MDALDMFLAIFHHIDRNILSPAMATHIVLVGSLAVLRGSGKLGTGLAADHAFSRLLLSSGLGADGVIGLFV